jgi:hypothetical protein
LNMAKWIMIAGAVLLVVGAILQLAPWAFSWFGRLPGDIRIETERGMVFIPITSMVIISVVLTLLINLFRR